LPRPKQEAIASAQADESYPGKSMSQCRFTAAASRDLEDIIDTIAENSGFDTADRRNPLNPQVIATGQ
jgi:hypothetical protein